MEVPTHYASALDLTQPSDAPSYQVCLDWMRTLPESRANTLDVWARGNYARRLLLQRRHGKVPLLVHARSVDEMRLIYRRLALLGLPIDLIYTGALAPEELRMHWYPLDAPIDAGWGYIAGIKTVVESKSGHRWFPILGAARLMPESVAEWLSDEMALAFSEGRVFVAPAALVGLPTAAIAGDDLLPLSDIANGTSVVPVVGAASALLDLELPTVDGMSASDFESFLRDHGDAITAFREAVSSVAARYYLSDRDRSEAIQRLRHEVAELIRAQRHQHLRAFIRQCKGSLTTFPVAVAALTGASAVFSKDPFAGTAFALSSGKVLRDLWNQARAMITTAPTQQFRILWDLGVTKVKTARRSRAFRPTPDPKPHADHHWLCPPTGGLAFLMRKNEKASSKPAT